MAKTGRPCRKCRVGLHYGSGFCVKCEPTATTDKWALHHKGKTTTQRGYGSEWEQLKRVVIKRDKGLCQMCLRNGVVTQATQVDHKIAKANGGTDKLTNLECICTPCHDKKTAKDRQ